MLRFSARSVLSPWSLLVLVSIAQAAPVSAEWRRLDSPNFVVVGDVGAGTLHDIAVRFEGFRETLSRVLSERVTATAVPTVVIIFPSDRAFTPFKPRYEGKPIDLSGLFVGGRDLNFIALRSDSNEDAMRIVFHEYAHLIIANVARNIPAWLNEGLAEYYSTYEVGRDGKEALIGRAIPSHLIRLNDTTLLPLKELLAVTHDSPLYNEGDRRSVFYAQSWALTHLLQLGEPPRTKKLGAYLNSLGQGEPPAVAWEQAFEADPIERDLRNYIARRGFNAYRYRFPDKLATFEASAAPLPLHDAEAFLAELLVAQQREDEASERLAKVAKSGASSALVATATARIHIEKKRYPAAEKELLALNEVSDWLAAYRAGVGVADLVAESGEHPKAEHLRAARGLFASARSQGREMPNGTARLVELELASAEAPPASTRSAIERVRLQAPGRYDYVILHARVLARESSFADARRILAPLMTPAYRQEVRDYARKLMGYIVQAERAATAGRATEGPGAAPPGERPSPEGASTADPRSRFLPVYRKLESGEQRAEGMLQRIECSGQSVVFHMMAADGPQRFSAPSARAVEFITYRDDLTGTVGCGALKEPMRVYLTWKTGSGEGERLAVAVEFLPKE